MSQAADASTIHRVGPGYVAEFMLGWRTVSVRITALACVLLIGSGCSLLFEEESTALSDGGIDPDRADSSQDAESDASPDGCTNTNLSLLDRIDDGEVYNGEHLPDGEFTPQVEQGVAMGDWLNLPVWAYFRFSLPEGLELANINSAHIRLWGRDSIDWVGANDALLIHLEDVSDSLPVEAGKQAPNESAGEPLVSTRTRWPASGGLDWQDEAYNVSSELKSLLLSLTDKSTVPAGGRHLTFWIRGDFVNERVVITNDLGLYDTNPAQLQIRTCP